MQFSRRQVCSSLGAMLVLPGCAWLRRGAPGGGADPAAFLAAVRAGDADRVGRMLTARPELARSTDAAGRSAYVLAFVHGHEQVAAQLRAAGSLELDIVEAVLAEDWPRFEQLATEDPGRLARAHPIGGTPLHAAALMGSTAFWRLRGQGCLPDATPPGGNGFTAARTAVDSAHAHWARISLSDLCSNGADVNAPQRGGSSVLHGAVARRDPDLVGLAIRKGADPGAVDVRGRTPHALALEVDWAEGAELLANHAILPRDNRSSRCALDAERQPITRPDLGDVPQQLQSAVTGNSHARLAKVRELVDADPRLTFSISTDDELAIEASAHMGNREIIRYHLDHGAPLSLPTAVALGDLDTARFWLERDPTLVHERGAHDFPVLFYAVFGGGSVAMAELLHGHGIALDQDSVGTTALHWCVRRREPDLARWLLEHGAHPEPVGYRWHRAGQTPLQVALADGATEMAALLRDAGARR